jgi:UDP-3-O-acyl-N-acetylglucosamine deacetylase
MLPIFTTTFVFTNHFSQFIHKKAFTKIKSKNKECKISKQDKTIPIDLKIVFYPVSKSHTLSRTIEFQNTFIGSSKQKIHFHNNP